MSTVQVDTAGNLFLARLPERDEVICMDAYEAMDLVAGLIEAIPELQAGLYEAVTIGGRDFAKAGSGGGGI